MPAWARLASAQLESVKAADVSGQPSLSEIVNRLTSCGRGSPTMAWGPEAPTQSGPVRVVSVGVLQGPAQVSDDGSDAAGSHVAAATGARRHSPEVALD